MSTAEAESNIGGLRESCTSLFLIFKELDIMPSPLERYGNDGKG